MQTPFKTIGLVGKPDVERISETLSMLHQHLVRRKIQAVVERNTARFIKEASLQTYDLTMLGKHCDLVIAVGGDGTFLTTARAVAAFEVPVIGVNLGRLGFLVDISPDEVLLRLDEILQGRYVAEERFLLRAQILRDNRVIHEETALNEVVVHRWITPSMIEIITTLNGIFLNSQRSDGLIVSTPTGSTAYALSGGGPLLHPSLNAMVLVPINPHTLTNRPIVIDGDSEVEIAFSQNKQINAQVTCDNVSIPDVLISDRIQIKKAPRPVKILHPVNYDFFEILRVKLNWSSGYHH